MTIKVNGAEVPIHNGEYQTMVTFPDPGEYEILVEAVDRQGQTAAHRRQVLVLGGEEGLVAHPLRLRLRQGSPIVSFVPGARGLQPGEYQKIVEVRQLQGEVLQRWTMPANLTDEISWNGADATGQLLPAGRYEVAYLISGPGGAVAQMRQPINLE